MSYTCIVVENVEKNKCLRHVGTTFLCIHRRSHTSTNEYVEVWGENSWVFRSQHSSRLSLQSLLASTVFGKHLGVGLSVSHTHCTHVTVEGLLWKGQAAHISLPGTKNFGK